MFIRSTDGSEEGRTQPRGPGQSRGTTVTTSPPGPPCAGRGTPSALFPVGPRSLGRLRPGLGQPRPTRRHRPLRWETDFYRRPSKGCVGGRGGPSSGGERKAAVGTHGAKRRETRTLWGALPVRPRDRPRRPALPHAIWTSPKQN